MGNVKNLESSRRLLMMRRELAKNCKQMSPGGLAMTIFGSKRPLTITRGFFQRREDSVFGSRKCVRTSGPCTDRHMEQSWPQKQPRTSCSKCRPLLHADLMRRGECTRKLLSARPKHVVQSCNR